MTNKVWLLVALALSFTLRSQAQTSSVCNTPEYKQFDFWVGDWQVFDYAKGSKGELVGTNQVEKILAGCVLQEHWLGAQGGAGTSFSTHDRLERRWHQTYVDDQGSLFTLNGQSQNGQMVMGGKHPGPSNQTVTERITWGVLAGNPNQVRQLWQQSRDDGQTWTVVFDGLYLRK